MKGLEREGYEVDRVANGAGALAHEGAELVLLDLRLPDLDGFEVCRRLRARVDASRSSWCRPGARRPTG